MEDVANISDIKEINKYCIKRQINRTYVICVYQYMHICKFR